MHPKGISAYNMHKLQRREKKKFEIVLLFYQLSFARCEYKKILNLMFSAVISSSNFAASDRESEMKDSYQQQNRLKFDECCLKKRNVQSLSLFLFAVNC
jgi:hypothetical protein